MSSRKEGLQGRLLLIFDDFGAPQGGSKVTKNQKKGFQKSIEKKDKKERPTQPVGGEGRRQSGSPGNPKIPLRKAFAKSRKQI